ncbi:hypothetical protein NKG94_15680 [Micromonospora sp. M12]
MTPDGEPPTTAEGVARRDAIAEEQEFLDLATARRDRLTDHLRAELSSEALDALERARQRMLRQQYDELQRAQEGLVFGRLDGVDGTRDTSAALVCATTAGTVSRCWWTGVLPQLGRSTRRRLSTHRVRHDAGTSVRRDRQSWVWTTSHWTGP